jgi:hypothetical protein
MAVNTDFGLPAQTFFVNAAVRITSYTKFSVQHGATQSLSAGGGLQALQLPNIAGRFGWVAFGKMIAGYYYVYPAQAINYLNQVFEPPNPNCNILRVWLNPGTTVSINCETEGLEKKYLKDIIQALESVALGYKAPVPSSTGAVQLPALAPGQ